MQNQIDIDSIKRSFGIIGRDPDLNRAVGAAAQAAAYDVSVLITGENGVGKEVFHKIIHAGSNRRFKKCITVNCGGLPEGTIDSELFGHVKGAFTGALADRKGYFEEANEGTIFLDEIGELPLSTQTRLLRILETGEYYRVGSSEVRKTNVRVVAATNVDLPKAIRQGRFREDLFYRLSTITIHIPPLRERGEDVLLLFKKFASDVADKYKMPTITLDNRAEYKLQAYQWPGNVRQLLHVVEEISIVEQDRVISSEILCRHLPHFEERVTFVSGNNSTDGSFSPGEKEMLYKVIFEMRSELNALKEHIGLHTPSKQTSAHHSFLPAPKALTADTSHIKENEATIIEPQQDETKAEESMGSIDYVQAETIEPASYKPKTLEEHTREIIEESMQRNKGNKRKVADELEVSERTLYRKLKDYGIQDNSFE